jgi:hypothetical protein
MLQMDIKKAVGELSTQYGIRIDANDPTIAVVLLNCLVLQHSANDLTNGVQTGLREFEEAVQRVQARAGQLVAAEFNDRVAALRGELQRDITLAGAKANEIVFRVEQASRHPVMIRWATLGIVAGLLLFLTGLWFGARYLHA